MMVVAAEVVVVEVVIEAEAAEEIEAVMAKDFKGRADSIEAHLEVEELNSAVAVTEADSEAVTEVDSVAEASEAEGVEVVEAMAVRCLYVDSTASQAAAIEPIKLIHKQVNQHVNSSIHQQVLALNLAPILFLVQAPFQIQNNKNNATTSIKSQHVVTCFVEKYTFCQVVKCKVKVNVLPSSIHPRNSNSTSNLTKIKKSK